MEPKVPKTNSLRTGEWDPLQATGRVAHSASQIRLNAVPVPGSQVPSQKRYQILDALYKESKRLYPSNEKVAKQVALEQELKLVRRSKTKSAYANLAATLIKRFRAAQIGQPNAKEFMPTIDMMKLPAGTDIMEVLGNEKMAQKILQKQNQVVRLSGIKLYKALKNYVMSHDELVANNYPLPSKEAKKVAIRNNMTEIKKKTTGQSEKRICVRCGKEFFIRKETGEVTGGECAYHAGKGFIDYRGYN